MVKMTNWQPIFKREISLCEIYIWAQAYVEEMKKMVGWNFKNLLFISEKGVEESFRDTEDLRSFRNFLKNELKTDSEYIVNSGAKIISCLRQWIEIAKNINKKDLKKLDNKKLAELFDEFCKKQKMFFSIIQFPVYIENSGIIFNKNQILQLKEIGKIRDKAAKKMYFIHNNERNILFSEIAKRMNISLKLCPLLLPDEIINFLLKNKQIVKQNILKARYDYYVLIVKKGKTNLFIGEKAKKIKIQALGDKDSIKSKTIKGKIGNKGKAAGTVKIIIRKAELKKIKKGDIFVSYMTIADFIPYLKKAAAFITDEGGITCHAAIVAREMNKPCIIGTKIATKVLRDGDLVEVDADKGVVKILSK